MNTIQLEEILNKNTYNLNRLVSLLSEKREFFGEDNLYQSLSEQADTLFPHYTSKFAYAKSLIITPKITNLEFCSKLQEISTFVDSLNVLTNSEESMYRDELDFFKKRFGKIQDLPKEVQYEYINRLKMINLYKFLSGDSNCKDLGIDFDKIKEKINKNKIFSSKIDLMGIGAMTYIISNLTYSPFYGDSVGNTIAQTCLLTGAFTNGIKILNFKPENSYLYLKKKCDRTDLLIKNII